MPEVRVGPYLGALIRFVTYSVVGAVFFFGGIVYYKLDIEESTVGILHEDSIVGQEETDKTQELKNEIDEFLRHNNPVDADGNYTAEWMQLMESQRSIARERGDQRSAVRKAADLLPK